MAEAEDFIPRDIRSLYEVHSFRSAAQVLATGCKAEFRELMEALRNFRLTIADIRKPGGNESDIPKKISGLLREKGWKETRIKGDLLIQKVSGSPRAARRRKRSDEDEAEGEDESETLQTIEELKRLGHDVELITRPNFLDGHKVDYVKSRVAFDMEWNSKDQTFDRDLYAKVGAPGDVVSSERFLDRVFTSVPLTDRDFTTENFVPGTGGEARLFRILRGKETLAP